MAGMAIEKVTTAIGLNETSLVIVLYFYIFFGGGGLECVGHYFAYVAHFAFLRDDWIRTQRAAVASWRATNLATHLSK